jgi:hypothetical protein
MKLHANIVATTQQWPTTARAFAPATIARPNVMLLKFATSEDRQALLRRHKGLARTKLGLDEDLTPAQQCASQNYDRCSKKPRRQASVPFSA